MKTFKLRVVASNKVFFDGECASLVIPINDGKMGILANHEEFVAAVEAGEMQITDKEGNVIEAFVGSGFIEFIDNDATFVCPSCELPEEIDARRAEEAKIRAEEELRQKQSIIEHHRSQANLARAMERLKIKNKHKI